MSFDNQITVGLISLGCDKNRVDSEKMLGVIAERFKISNDVAVCDVLIINTCAFLQSSRAEAIQTVFEYAPLKGQTKLKKIILAGCLPQKFIAEIFNELVEVDAFLGTFDGSLIIDAITKVLTTDERLNLVGKGKELGNYRCLTTPSHYAYLKIADGCNNHCTYCLIPKIRGKFKSYAMDDLVCEAKDLGELKELILVAQDTTRYGEDLYGKPMLVPLIKKLSALDNISSIRLLYCYPDKIDEDLINELATNPKLIKYVDIPLQHADDRILKVMNRKGSYESYLQLITNLKQRVQGIAIRSTFITGFPTETEHEHKRLIEFIKRAKLFNAGFFAYSRECDTPSYKLPNQVHPNTKRRRLKELYKVQTEIARQNVAQFFGKTLQVVCDGVDYEKQAFFGRAYFSAPDVDGRVYFSSSNSICQGETYQVKITRTEDFDLFGEIQDELT